MLMQHRVSATRAKGQSAAQILAGALGWWDASTYTSGAWANAGTGGSALNFNLGASTAAPSFSAGVFTFDGVNDYMYITDAAAIDVAASESLTLGIVFNPTGAVTSGARVFGKDNGSGQMYGLRFTTGGNMLVATNDGSQAANATLGIPTVNSYQLVAGVRNTSTDQLTGYLGATPGTPTTLTAEAAINNTHELRIGPIATSPVLIPFKVKAAFLFKRALSTAELTLIKNYYNV